MSKPYEDPEKLARARWRGGKKHSYEEMAEELNCSVGTISLRMRKYEDELEQYGPSDFEDLPTSHVVDNRESPYPLDVDLPSGLPTHVQNGPYEGTSVQILIEEARWGCWSCTPILDDLLQDQFDTTFEDCIIPE